MTKRSWTDSDWDSFKTTRKIHKHTSVREIFNREGINADFDPRNIKFRESVDSKENPNSTPIIIALDVTGSMGQIPESLIKDGLGRMATEIIERKPVTDPHIMFMAVGDAVYDTAPLQATQFEADIRIAEQLKELYLEGGGGGNACESYNLPWYFAARKTHIDSFNKRSKKGVLFTIGDEEYPRILEASHIKHFVGDDVQADIPSDELLRMAQERYDVYHLMIKEGFNYTEQSHQQWTDLLGQRAMPVADYTKIPEIIVSTLEVLGGKAKDEITASWDGDTSLVVKEAIGGLTESSVDADTAVWRPKRLGM